METALLAKTIRRLAHYIWTIRFEISEEECSAGMKSLNIVEQLGLFKANSKRDDETLDVAPALSLVKAANNAPKTKWWKTEWNHYSDFY